MSFKNRPGRRAAGPAGDPGRRRRRPPPRAGQPHRRAVSQVGNARPARARRPQGPRAGAAAGRDPQGCGGGTGHTASNSPPGRRTPPSGRPRKPRGRPRCWPRARPPTTRRTNWWWRHSRLRVLPDVATDGGGPAP